MTRQKTFATHMSEDILPVSSSAALGWLNDIAAAQVSYIDYVTGLQEFRVACNNRDWPAAELARLKTATMLDAYIDSMVAAYRRMDVRRQRGGA